MVQLTKPIFTTYQNRAVTYRNIQLVVNL